MVELKCVVQTIAPQYRHSGRLVQEHTAAGCHHYAMLY